MTTKPTYEELEQRLEKVQEEDLKRRQTEEAVQKREQEFRNLFDSIPDPVTIIQENQSVLLNKEFTRLLGYDQNDIEKGLSPSDIIEEDEDKKIMQKRVERRFAGEKIAPEYHIVTLVGKDGQTIPFEAKGTLIRYNGRPADLVVFRDIAKHKKADELIHALTQQLIKAQENERQKISRELHDRVAQDLSAARIACEMLLDDELGVSSEGHQRLSDLSETLRTTITNVRDLSYDLRPPGLEALGLVRTLYQYCMDFAEKNVLKVDFKSAGVDKLRFNFDTEINLYRIVQEGLSNIRNHAEAGNVMIKLVFSFPNIILRIEDDGKGFNMQERMEAAFKEKRMGLQNIEQRVSLLEGEIDIQSRPMKGTKISIKIPYNP
jgi:PAS domain S-box-containing protein